MRYSVFPKIGFVAALLVASTLVPGIAQAAGPITIVSAGNPPGQPSVLNVRVTDSTANITSVGAVLTPVGGGGTFTPPSLTLSSGTAKNGTWSTTISPGAIAVGDYTVAVTAQDAASNSASAPDAGTLAYLNQPTLTAMSDMTEVSYGNQTVTFSGQLTAVPPGGGMAVPEAGIQINYSDNGGKPLPLATTMSDGTYSGQVQNVTVGNWTMSAKATSTMAAAQSSPIAITAIAQPISFSVLKVLPAKPKFGQTATLTGTVDILGGPGSPVVADTPVQSADGNHTLPTVKTDSNGNFSVSFSTKYGNNLSVTAGANNPLFTPANFGVSFPLEWPLESKSFKATLRGNGFVLSSICILASRVNVTPSFDANSVELEYAPARKGPWRRLGRLNAIESFSAPSNCQGQWLYYSDVEQPIPGRLLSAFYRVVVPSNGATEPFQSPVVHSALRRSRIVSFNVRPRTVYQGGTITVSGHVERQSGRTWRSYARVKVLILARRKGSKTFVVLASVRANRSGHFSHKFTAGAGKGKLYFAAYFPGSSAYLWSLSRQILVGFNEPAAASAPVIDAMTGLLARSSIAPQVRGRLGLALVEP